MIQSFLHRYQLIQYKRKGKVLRLNMVLVMGLEGQLIQQTKVK